MKWCAVPIACIAVSFVGGCQLGTPAESALLPTEEVSWALPEGLRYMQPWLYGEDTSAILGIVNLDDSTYEVRGQQGLDYSFDLRAWWQVSPYDHFDVYHLITPDSLLIYRAVHPRRWGMVVASTGQLSEVSFDSVLPVYSDAFEVWIHASSRPLYDGEYLITGLYAQTGLALDAPLAVRWHRTDEQWRFDRFLGTYPASWKGEGQAPYHPYPSWCKGWDEKLICSFWSEANLYEAQADTLISRGNAVSEWLPESDDFDLSQASDMNYLRHYLHASGRYQKVVYDPWRKQYYRAVLHPGVVPDADQSWPDPRDRGWSLQVLTGDGKLIAEYPFQDMFEHHYHLMFATPDALLVGKIGDSLASPGVYFSKYEL